MEAREELRLFHAGFRPVRRGYVVAALLATAAALTAELWIVQRHATWLEACFKPWRSSLTLVLQAFLTTLRLLRSSASKLCLFVKKQCSPMKELFPVFGMCCVGLLFLVVVYFFVVAFVVIVVVSRHKLDTVLSSQLEGKYVVDHALEKDHVLNDRLYWQSHSINEANHPVTEWRYIGESVKLSCHRYFQSSHEMATHFGDMAWVHNGSIMRKDDDRYEITHRIVCPTSICPDWYILTLEVTIGFVEDWHFGEYDCVSLVEMDRRYHPRNTRNPTDPQHGRPQHTYAGFKRIGRVHLKQIFPETRIIVMPIGGILNNVGAGWLLTPDEQDIPLKYTVDGKPVFSDDASHRTQASPFISTYFEYKTGITRQELPFLKLYNETNRYVFHQALPFPPEAFGEHQITFFRYITNRTTGKTELREFKFPVTFVFRPSPPILMEFFLLLWNVSDATVDDLTDPFFASWAGLCVKAEGIILWFVEGTLFSLVILKIAWNFQEAILLLWHGIFEFEFQCPPHKILADICVTEPQEPELRYDVFLSYACEDPEDRRFVLQVLLPRLQNLGMSVCLPERERAPNLSELRGTSCLMQACTYYIVVVTPSYIECGMCNRLELPFILSRFQHREVDDHQVVLVKLRPCVIPGGLRCSLPVVDLTRNQGLDQLDNIIMGWTPRNEMKLLDWLSE